MDEILFDAVIAYYNILKVRGYHSYADAFHLLALCFYRDFVFHDYNGVLTKEDYSLIEKALNCLFGSTCLIPYPDYLKMGKLHIGETTELAQRIKVIEEADVLKVMREDDSKTQNTTIKKSGVKMVKV